MITNRRMGLKIWRIQRIKIPGITESKRKPLDHKARQRVGMTAEKAKTLTVQRFGPAQIDSDNQMITVTKAVLTENCAGGFGVKARKTPPGDHPL